jgi:hypothetical protein
MPPATLRSWMKWTPSARATLDLDRLRRTGGDYGAGPSHQASEHIPNPRVRVMQRLPSPSPTPPAYWSMEPSDLGTSLRSHWELSCAIHGMGPCPYPVAQRQPVLSSSGMREGEEGVVDADDVVEVTIVEEEDDDEPVKVIPVPDPTPPRPAYKQSVRIRIGPRG